MSKISSKFTDSSLGPSIAILINLEHALTNQTVCVVSGATRNHLGGCKIKKISLWGGGGGACSQTPLDRACLYTDTIAAATCTSPPPPPPEKSPI